MYKVGVNFLWNCDVGTDAMQFSTRQCVFKTNYIEESMSTFGPFPLTLALSMNFVTWVEEHCVASGGKQRHHLSKIKGGPPWQ